MRHNQNIDFFSSPHSRFIGFSDIRHPQHDINQQQGIVFESAEEQRKIGRKLSFSGASIIEPIVPLEEDFFNEKPQEFQEPVEYSPQHQPQQINENSLMMETHFRSPQLVEKSPVRKFKQTQLQYTGNAMRLVPQDMPQFEQKQDSVPCKIQQHQEQMYTTPKRKSQFSTARKSCLSTAQKAVSRNNEKGLRRLSSLAYSIVSQFTTTTYKQVAEELLSHLNYPNMQMEDEDGTEKSSMQNVKRRVYDSLNVLLALGVIKRVGSKIAKQKQRKPFAVDNSLDIERYNQMLQEYNTRVKALQTKKRTQRELKEKLQIFKKTVEKNRKMKLASKNKLIRLPFLAFVSKDQGEVEWVRKESVENGEKKKVIGKRGQAKQQQKQKSKENDDLVVKIGYKGYPQSYGDLDFFKLLQQQPQLFVPSEVQIAQHQIQPIKGSIFSQQLEEEFKYPMQQYEHEHHCGNQMMSLIDEVFEQE